MRKLTVIAALIATLMVCGGGGDVETPAAAFVLTDADQDAVKVHYRDPPFATKLFENWTVSKCVDNKKPKDELDRQVVSAGIFGHPLFTAANHVLEFRLRVIERKRETLTKLAQKFRKFGKETIPTVMRELDDIPRRPIAASPPPIPINASPVDMVDARAGSSTDWHGWPLHADRQDPPRARCRARSPESPTPLPFGEPSPGGTAGYAGDYDIGMDGLGVRFVVQSNGSVSSCSNAPV